MPRTAIAAILNRIAGVILLLVATAVLLLNEAWNEAAETESPARPAAAALSIGTRGAAPRHAPRTDVQRQAALQSRERSATRKGKHEGNTHTNEIRGRIPRGAPAENSQLIASDDEMGRLEELSRRKCVQQGLHRTLGYREHPDFVYLRGCNTPVIHDVVEWSKGQCEHTQEFATATNKSIVLVHTSWIVDVPSASSSATSSDIDLDAFVHSFVATQHATTHLNVWIHSRAPTNAADGADATTHLTGLYAQYSAMVTFIDAESRMEMLGRRTCLGGKAGMDHPKTLQSRLELFRLVLLTVKGVSKHVSAQCHLQRHLAFSQRTPCHTQRTLFHSLRVFSNNFVHRFMHRFSRSPCCC
jgi:hypothetical protein